MRAALDPASPERAAAAARRDPAWAGRVFWLGAGLVLLWPLLVATEFRPWILLESRNLKVTGDFLASFVPPAHAPDFLLMVARETWRTVAIATAGMTLALVVALPMTLLATRVLSVSALSGRMARLPWLVRQVARWTLVALRSVPGAPQLPAGYPAMVMLALLPPLWSRVMDPRVAAVGTAS